ncbi:MAG: threonine aldolase family protein [Gammaproteobacteria bacterium]|nr:threonine aldolase family protein [Gammaproteobacteria bacterium]
MLTQTQTNNVSTSTGINPADYAQYFDSIWIDFAKGLGAPMGAVVAGSQSFIVSPRVSHLLYQ